ncbi:MAG: ABC transporter permease [Lachnospiraceae bacterium]|nr:ABC transporter permease [Lachnospiraceae bacterium]
MFFKLVSRNSKRTGKENGLFFSSLIVSIVAFYIILSLPQQDVMLFLKEMESDAVNRLMGMIPIFYGMTLVILFFLIYYAGKFQMERRRHEFGVYLMMGMRRFKLFVMLLAEDLRSSIVSLVIGLPIAVLLSELISLITARFVGMGVVGHQSSFSLKAVLWTAAGFMLVKLIAFFILSGKISRQEIGSLLVDTPKGSKKQFSPTVYAISLSAGLFCLIAAYAMAIDGMAWRDFINMVFAVILGLLGTFLLFWGLRFPIGYIAKNGGCKRRLHIFNFRQIEENIVHSSGLLAVCSLLILAAMCCFGSGIAIERFYNCSDQKVLDYTFTAYEHDDVQRIREVLAEYKLDNQFSDLFEMKIGNIRSGAPMGTYEYENAFRMDSVMNALSEMPESEDREVLINNLGCATAPYSPFLISAEGYNRLLSLAGKPTVDLQPNEAAVYMGNDFTTENRKEILNSILSDKPKVKILDDEFYLTGEVQSLNVVTDRSISLSFAIVLPDDKFELYTKGDYEIYLDGVLASSATENISLMTAISNMNQKLNETGLIYESYLQNMGRQLFYMVATSYITIYLSIIFIIVANTIIGVQFLMSQQKTNRRYRTLIRLGADYETLYKSAKRQINLYFGIPIAVALMSSIFGVRALFTGLLSSRTSNNIFEMMCVSGAMILLLCVVEFIYIFAVKRSSGRYLLTLIEPLREE